MLVVVLVLDFFGRRKPADCQQRSKIENENEDDDEALSPLWGCPFGAQTRLLSGGGSGVFLDQHDQVVGSIPDGGNVRLGERLIRNELLANAI